MPKVTRFNDTSSIIHFSSVAGSLLPVFAMISVALD